MAQSLEPVASSSYTPLNVDFHTQVNSCLRQFVVILANESPPPLTSHNTFPCTASGYRNIFNQFDNTTTRLTTDTLTKRIWLQIRHLPNLERQRKIEELKNHPPKDLYKHLIGHQVLERDLLNTKEDYLDVGNLIAITFEDSDKTLLGYILKVEDDIVKVETIKHLNVTVPLKYVHPLNRDFLKKIKPSESKERTLRRYVFEDNFALLSDRYIKEGALVAVREENRTFMQTGFISRRGGTLRPSLFASGYSISEEGENQRSYKTMFYARVTDLFPLKPTFLKKERKGYLDAYQASLDYLKQRCTRDQSENTPIILLSPSGAKASYSINDCSLAFTTSEKIEEVETALRRHNPGIEVYDIEELKGYNHPWI